MKQININIHPFSALAGMALLGLVLVTAGAMPLQGSSSTRDVSAIENVNEPHPRDYVRIKEGTPFVVPSGKCLVVKSLSYSTYNGSTHVQLRINGVDAYSGTMVGGKSEITPGFLAVAGESVSVHRDGVIALALGYLVDA